MEVGLGGDGHVAHGDRGSAQGVDRPLQHVEFQAGRIGIEGDHLPPRMHASIGATGNAQRDGVAEHALDRLTQSGAHGDDALVLGEAVEGGTVVRDGHTNSDHRHPALPGAARALRLLSA